MAQTSKNNNNSVDDECNIPWAIIQVLFKPSCTNENECNHTMLPCVVISTQCHAAGEPFNHRAVILHKLCLYYMRHQHFPKASGITQCLAGGKKKKRER